jgi:hypothetical protein
MYFTIHDSPTSEKLNAVYRETSSLGLSQTEPCPIAGEDTIRQ